MPSGRGWRIGSSGVASKGYAVRREPSEHAAGKWIYLLFHAGGAARIEIDSNYPCATLVTAWIACHHRQLDPMARRKCRFSTTTRSSPAKCLRWWRAARRAIGSMHIGSACSRADDQQGGHFDNRCERQEDSTGGQPRSTRSDARSATSPAS